MSSFYENNPIYKSGLPASAILVYFYLEKNGAKYNRCFHSIKTISRNLHINMTTVSRSLNKLENNNYIVRTRQYRKDGGKTSNLYQIIK